MQAISNALQSLDADVVTLQEVWTSDTGGVLKEAGTRTGLVHHFDAQALTGGSGLVVLSRHPVSRSRFVPYLMAGLPERVWHGDYWGGKGYVELEIAHPSGPFTLIDTHLQAQYSEDTYPSYRTHRMGQIVQLASGVSQNPAPVIAAGDFNMHETSPEYRAFTGLAGVRDCAAELDHRQPTSLRSNPYHAGLGADDARIDYVFVRNGADSAIEVEATKRIFDADIQIEGRRAAYSDHAGLWTDLSLRHHASSTARPDTAAIELARAGLSRGRDLAEQRKGRRRTAAVASFGVGALALAGLRSQPLDRRRFLRGLLGTAAAAGASSTLGFAALSELAISQELENYRAVARLLDEMASRVKTGA